MTLRPLNDTFPKNMAYNFFGDLFMWHLVRQKHIQLMIFLDRNYQRCQMGHTIELFNNINMSWVALSCLLFVYVA